jgi:ribonuclease J
MRRHPSQEGPTTDYIIHRGRDEIGGMCIEVAADDGTRILLDLGMPLYDEAGNDYPFDTPQRPTAELRAEGVLRDIPGLYRNDPSSPGFAAIFLTHSHADHHGLAHHAHPAIPVYGSKGTVIMLQDVAPVFFPQSTLPADLRELSESQTEQAGSLSVTAIPVDHSAPDSRAFLVEGDGQRLLYSGDLRAHGRTGFRFEKLLADRRVHGVDVLLHEATTLGRGGGGHGFRSEEQVEDALLSLTREGPDDLVAVMSSGQNVDRLVSCFKAARKSGRLLVIDPYQAFVLLKLAPLSPNIPQFSWDGIGIGVLRHQIESLEKAGLTELAGQMRGQAGVSSDAMAADPGHYLVCARGSYTNTQLLEKIGGGRVALVWSMWGGYWKRPKCPMRTWAKRAGVPPHFIHSGGHAWPDDIERLLAAIEPVEVVAVHTDTRGPDSHA